MKSLCRPSSAPPKSRRISCRPAVLRSGPIFGFGYRSPWLLGNIIQAKVARECGLNVMLAQQSARELERTGRTFRAVVASAAASARAAGLRRPWGADGDHLKSDAHIRAAAAAGCTHFTYDVTGELRQGLEPTAARLTAMFRLTAALRRGCPFTSEISMDETEHVTRLEDVLRLLQMLRRRGVAVTEIAPRFPGFFEKAIDYYLRVDHGRRVALTDEFERYLRALAEVLRGFGVRVCLHSGSDKFAVYPVVARVLRGDFHLKTAGTYYLEELKIVARHAPDLFRTIHAFSLACFQRDRASYELSADPARLPELRSLDGPALAALLQSGDGHDDLRQVLHVTYGSVLTAQDPCGRPRFADAMADVLRRHADDYEREMRAHLLRHIRPFGLG